MLALLNRYFQPRSLLDKLLSLQEQDKELDTQIAALQPHVDKLKNLMGRLNSAQMQGSLKPILKPDPSVKEVASELELLLQVREQLSNKKLLEQFQRLSALQAERQKLAVRVGAIKGAVKATEEQSQRFEEVVQKAEQNDAELAQLAVEASRIAREFPKYT